MEMAGKGNLLRGAFLLFFVCEKMGDPLEKESFTTRKAVIFPPKVAKPLNLLGTSDMGSHPYGGCPRFGVTRKAEMAMECR